MPKTAGQILLRSLRSEKTLTMIVVLLMDKDGARNYGVHVLQPKA